MMELIEGERTADVIAGDYPRERRQVERRVEEIMAAAEARDVDLLESYHAFGPKFTKFDDFEPLERQDGETTRRLEREAIAGVREFRPAVVDLKVDVFGLAAVATFEFEYRVVPEQGDELELRSRGTLVLASDGSDWKLVHEHFSPFTAAG